MGGAREAWGSYLAEDGGALNHAIACPNAMIRFNVITLLKLAGSADAFSHESAQATIGVVMCGHTRVIDRTLA